MARNKRSRAVSNPSCQGCPSLCCRDLVLPIDKPKTPDDVEELKWHVQYDTVSVFVRTHRWYLLIEGRCQYLSGDSLCRIYDRRPARCRRHNPPGCERFADFYDVLIESPEELEEYLGRERSRTRKRRAARPS